MPAHSIVETNAWRRENQDVIEWLIDRSNLRDRFLLDVATYCEQHGMLTPRQTAAVRRNMERTPPPDVPRQAYETALTVEIHNGTYTLDDGRQHLTFKVRTIRQSRNPDMVGRRVVARLIAGNTYENFAFIYDGGLSLWRRYREHENELYVRWARILVRTLLNEPTLLSNGTVSEAFIYANEDQELREVALTIQTSRSCRVCNRTLTDPTSIETGIGPECSAREHNRTHAAETPETIPPEPIRMVSPSVARRARRPILNPRPSTTEPAARVLAMSEVDASLVQ